MARNCRTRPLNANHFTSRKLILKYTHGTIDACLPQHNLLMELRKPIVSMDSHNLVFSLSIYVGCHTLVLSFFCLKNSTPRSKVVYSLAHEGKNYSNFDRLQTIITEKLNMIDKMFQRIQESPSLSFQNKNFFRLNRYIPNVFFSH